MNTAIFNFGMKHWKSKCRILRFLAKICIELEKRAADRIERKLKKESEKSMSEEDEKFIWNQICEKCTKKG